MKIAFLDRDGTIVQEYPDEEWVYISEPEFMDGAIEGMKVFQEKGYKLVIITNQPLINQGIITEEQYASFTKKMLNELNKNGVSIFKIKYCPHTRLEGCSCIKPKTGMIDSICAEHPELNLEESFLAGDSNSDIELAKTLGIRSFKIDPKAQELDSHIVSSLRDIIAYL